MFHMPANRQHIESTESTESNESNESTESTESTRRPSNKSTESTTQLELRANTSKQPTTTRAKPCFLEDPLRINWYTYVSWFQFACSLIVLIACWVDPILISFISTFVALIPCMILDLYLLLLVCFLGVSVKAQASRLPSPRHISSSSSEMHELRYRQAPLDSATASPGRWNEPRLRRRVVAILLQPSGSTRGGADHPFPCRLRAARRE